MSELIALDIGNGSVKWGRFVDGERIESGRLAHDASPDAFAADIPMAAVSVNPAVAERWKSQRPSLALLGRDLPLPLAVEYRPPEDCGDDRVATAAGALHWVPGHETVLVLDAGTCLVATVATRQRGVVGGAILPGRDLMAHSLHHGTAALPLVDASPPRGGIGDSTAESIRLGIDAALIGAARELIRRVRAEMGADIPVLSTGTGAETLAERVAEIHSPHPHLTLWGVYLAARNAGTRG